MNGCDAMFPQHADGCGVRARNLADDNVLANDFAPVCTVRRGFDYIEVDFA
jgi:hypothetical protein